MAIVLVGTYCLDDGWYGDRHRVILSDFRTKTEARKYAARLKKYIKEEYNVDPKILDISCGEPETYVPYTYVSFGPSLSYTHHEVSIEELTSYLS